MTHRIVRFDSIFADKTRNGLTKPKRVRGQGVKLINMGEIFSHDRIKNLTTDRVPVEKKEEIAILKESDLLFARQSLVLEGAGKCSIFLSDDEPNVFESHIVRVRLDSDVANPLFYFYYFKSPPGRTAIESIVEQGAGVAGIRGKDLAALPVDYIDKKEQDKIANILGRLDDKIELNERMNETLEQMAQAIFKDWFVDFGPVRAKMEGREPYLSREIWDLFPARLDEGGKPESWQYASIYDFASVIYGAPFSSKKFNEDGVGLPLIRVRDLSHHDPRVWTDEVHSKGHKVNPGDIVVGMDGEFRAHVWKGPQAWLNQRVCKFGPKKPEFKSFIYEAIKSPLYSCEQWKTGTTVIHLGKSDIDKFKIISPGEDVLEAYRDVVECMFSRVVENAQENKVLRETRELLLPKLMSGDIAVRDAEREVEEAV